MANEPEIMDNPQRLNGQKTTTWNHSLYLDLLMHQKLYALWEVFPTKPEH